MDRHKIYVSVKTGFGIHDLKERMARLVSTDGSEKHLVNPLDIVVLVDKAAPKGRLILPQQQVIRDLLDSGAMPIDLDKLEVGDRFTLDVLNETFTYEVDQILVTLPEETEELYIQNGKDLVTLYTCTPYGVNTHRLLVRGHRVTEPEE